MHPFHLIVGSQQGNTEFIADELAAELLRLGFEAIVHEQPEYDHIPQYDCNWIVCTSTFGAGEFPDNIQGLWMIWGRKNGMIASRSIGLIPLIRKKSH